MRDGDFTEDEISLIAAGISLQRGKLPEAVNKCEHVVLLGLLVLALLLCSETPSDRVVHSPSPRTEGGSLAGPIERGTGERRSVNGRSSRVSG